MKRLLITVLLLLAFAAPAHATLLVRSDGAGLFIQDKNGIKDNADMFKVTVNGQPAYQIRNLNDLDVFKFDRRTGCEETNSFTVTCERNGSAINVLLAGGGDTFHMGGTPAGVASVAGGFGSDHIIGHIGRDNLHGQLGDDELTGAGGNDDLEGDEEDDRLDGGAGDDDLDGGTGTDRLEGSTGADVLRGGDGNDTHRAREPTGSTAVTDIVSCGAGTDFAEGDLKDAVSGSCENQDIGAVGETPNVRLPGKSLRISRTGRVRVRLRCPRGVKRLGCMGRLQLRLGRSAGSSRSRRVGYRIKAGRRKTVTLKLTRRDVRSIRRRGRRARGILTSVERGRKGRKTTIRNPRLRLR
jgi:Ca2+-binding RTX toxin-like protein